MNCCYFKICCFYCGFEKPPSRSGYEDLDKPTVSSSDVVDGPPMVGPGQARPLVDGQRVLSINNDDSVIKRQPPKRDTLKSDFDVTECDDSVSGYQTYRDTSHFSPADESSTHDEAGPRQMPHYQPRPLVRINPRARVVQRSDSTQPSDEIEKVSPSMSIMVYAIDLIMCM